MTNLLAHDSGTVAEQPIDLTDYGVGIVTTFYNPLGVAGVEIGAYGDGETTSPSVINLYDADHNGRLFLYGNGSIVGRNALSQNIFEVWSAASFTTSVTAPRLISTVATGTAPLTVTSNTKVTNLNADLLDGNDASAFETAGTSATHAALTAAHGATGAVVGTTNSQTLTNKTLSAASNTITVSASGLTATSLNAALLEILNRTKGRVRVIEAKAPSAFAATAFDYTGGGMIGASAANEKLPTWSFANSALQTVDFFCVLENYNGGNIDFEVPIAASVTSGSSNWVVSIRRIGNNLTDLDSSFDYFGGTGNVDFWGMSIAAPTSIGQFRHGVVTFPSGSASLRSIANNEYFVLRVVRDATYVGDTLEGTVYMLPPIGYET